MAYEVVTIDTIALSAQGNKCIPLEVNSEAAGNEAIHRQCFSTAITCYLSYSGGLCQEQSTLTINSSSIMLCLNFYGHCKLVRCGWGRGSHSRKQCRMRLFLNYQLYYICRHVAAQHGASGALLGRDMLAQIPWVGYCRKRMQLKALLSVLHCLIEVEINDIKSGIPKRYVLNIYFSD